ncbi:MAG: tripartite tricarboxylate transporter substrate binding protein [Bacteroidetes bacterium]|nr:tripartite tricarboxylate transporter substrate binding protein [Bacteroidota bacterium]
MEGLTIRLAAVVAVASLLVAGCSQAVPAASPTKAPAAPTTAAKVAEPTKAAAAQPAAPSTSANYPVKGKTISLISPFAAGGVTDIGGRLLAPLLEKELGTPVEVVNKPGAGSQVGITEAARAKPDGYTLGMTNLPTTITLYLDPPRKAVFNRKSFQPIGLHGVDPAGIAVKADSPYKTMKDLIDAAKANPKKIKVSTAGRMGGPHLAVLDTERVAGVQFAVVHFDGASEGMTALLGGHTDAQFGYLGSWVGPVKNGEVRVLGVMDKQESKYLPGVKTMESQGYKLYHQNSRGWSAPAGTPMEIVDTLAAALKRAMDSPEHKQKMDEQGVELRYMNPTEFGAYWEETEVQVKQLMESVTQ